MLCSWYILNRSSKSERCSPVFRSTSLTGLGLQRCGVTVSGNTVGLFPLLSAPQYGDVIVGPQCLRSGPCPRGFGQHSSGSAFLSVFPFSHQPCCLLQPQEGPLILYVPRGATWLTPVWPGPSQLLTRVICARFLCHLSINWSWLLRGYDCALTIVPLLLRPVPFSLPRGHFFQL